jgi:hypothetical protein
MGISPKHDNIAAEVSDQIEAYVSNIVRSKVHNGDVIFALVELVKSSSHMV